MRKSTVTKIVASVLLASFASSSFAQSNDSQAAPSFQAPNFGTQSDPYADAFNYEYNKRHAHTAITPEMEQAAQAQCKENYWGWLSDLDEVCLAGIQIGKRAYEEQGAPMPKVLAECSKFSSNGSSQNACFAGAYFVIGKGPRLWTESQVPH